MKKSLEDYKEMVVKPQFDWIKIHWKGWMLIMIISACIPYAALFCLEYKIRPGDIEFELCIYQNDEVVVFNPTAEDILPIMDKIVHLDKILAECDAEEA